ncbi:MFS transporter [Trujillonella endophytica]|uniref:Drug resistance transporter, EmrB/QacA subfamily n=1 Tax=Trujillonella endophytica TaxID=673521 RepID=A0A1H8Q4N6_9ACTN|nr:MFS transporter [Trujillella endophytica]SEO48978.1 drug resistance transporter, EmrB/QacA subfamily [Trujillella endophytica]
MWLRSSEPPETAATGGGFPTGSAAPGPSRRAVLAVLAVGVLTFALLQSMVLPVLPTLQERLGTTQSGVSWLITGNLLASAVATPIVGRLGDIHGRQRMLVVSLGTLGAGCLLCSSATSLPLMIGGRVLQGFGAAVAPLAFGIVRDVFPDRAVPRAISALSPMLALGAAAGLTLAGPVVGLLGVPWLFWLPMIAVLVAAVAAYRVVPPSTVRAPGRINWLAAALLTGWLVCMLLAVSWAPTRGWTSPTVLGLLACVAVFAPLWGAVELRSEQPLIDLRLMRLRVVWTANLVAVLLFFGVFAALVLVPQLLQTDPSAGYGFGASNTESGLLLLPQSAASFVLGLSAGWLAARIGFRRVLVVAALVGATGYATLALAHDQLWHVQVALVLAGAGLGLSQAALANVVVSGVPQNRTGVAGGMYANLRTIGGSLGTAVTTTVVTAGAGSDGVPAEGGYTAAFLVLAATAAAAALGALVIRGASRPSSAAVRG